MKHRRTAATVVTALALGVALTACTSIASSGSGEAAPAKTPTANQSKAIADAEAAAGIPPKPDATTQAKYIQALTRIDAEIVNGKPDKAVSRGRNQCSMIHNFPKDKAKQVDSAELRFISPNHPEGFGKAKAAQIVEAVHTHLCPKF
ncbi:hypothetical protein ACFCWG_44060 [Streptomyces sp. NPDC056390]|uniref:hypothetical protein n=1 Tax=Streptomyces sp. NPDC056390 TaxID=3345806 RepID=UPI0035E37EE6